MNIIHTLLSFMKGILLLKLSEIALFIGDFSVIGSCWGFFHEDEMPKELQESNPFLQKENH